jgi:protein-L-isoaspartate(D-aspartate) O-methyltransferase
MQQNFESLRVNMVNSQLRTTDVTSHALLTAFLSVPRELFVQEEQRSLAYLDRSIEVAKHRYVMEASALAKLLQLANIGSRDKVLIIGASTGYSAALVSHIAASVIALESVNKLHESCKTTLAALNITNVTPILGALEAGAQFQGPYEVIFIEGSVDTVPTSLYDQLTNGGRLITVQKQGPLRSASCSLKSGTVTSQTLSFNVPVKSLPEFQAVPRFSLFS